MYPTKQTTYNFYPYGNIQQGQYVTPVNFVQPNQINQIQNLSDEIKIETSAINKKPLVDRKIIKENQDINAFFDDISEQIFSNSNIKDRFARLLKDGYISLSSSCYNDIHHPQSAVALKLNPKKMTFQNCAFLEECIKNGVGVGINFNNFQNPTREIKEINNYFNFRQGTSLRPPAGIALLSVHHPEIIDFITLKDDKDYDNWRFDLSVIIDDEFFSALDKNSTILMQDGSERSAKEIYSKLLKSMKKSGEPGVIFSNNPDFLCDCCVASELDENQALILGQVNLAKFYDSKNKKYDFEFLKSSASILNQAVNKLNEKSNHKAYIGVVGYQELLDKMNLSYSQDKSLKILDDCFKAIKSTGAKIALSPTGTTSRILKTTPSIEPNNPQSLSYFKQLEPLVTVQKYIDGGISKTIHLKKTHDEQDIDEIIRYAYNNKLLGISVFVD